jgi:uncharacterized protein (TIGR01777 family)
VKILILGASGFIGTRLKAALQRRGDEVVGASLREPDSAAEIAAGCDAIVNLAGEQIAQRWSDAAKRRMEQSRIEAPRRFLNALAARRPHAGGVYVSASAVGYYGTSQTETFVEESPAGTDFLARLCIGWEREANRAAALGMRVAIVRTGIVLDIGGGALAKMLPAFRVGLGGIVGNGRQWLSWVHVDDLVGVYLKAIDEANGPLNACAPGPVTNATFTLELGRALHRPVLLPVPTFALRVLLGEGAGVLLLGQRVLPRRTQELGYRFAFPEITGALANLL